MPSTDFAQQLVQWFHHHGRKNLPWQQQPTPYRVWVSEIMLQQTQVATVIDYYQRFMQQLPTLEDLARAPQDQVMQLWAGLGYYTRARNLHACAQQVMQEHQGHFPIHSLDAMQSLPGIGPSTAAAIIALSSNQRAVILDGNVKRVLARYAAVEGWPGKSAINKRLWQLADQLTPADQAAAYTQAIMDLGATLCTPKQPACERCPVAQGCQAKRLGLARQLPTPKPKKKLPEQQRLFLLLIKEPRQLLLQKRPQQGIWGGLWSLPEFTSHAELQNWLQLHYPGAQLAAQPDTGFRHTFSHYHLQIQPWQAQLAATALQEPVTCYQPTSDSKGKMTAAEQLWYNLETEASPPGLPAPIQRLLKGLQK